MTRITAVLRRRIAWHGWSRRVDTSRNWPRITWMWWSWDRLPAQIAEKVGGILDDLWERGR